MDNSDVPHDRQIDLTFCSVNLYIKHGNNLIATTKLHELLTSDGRKCKSINYGYVPFFCISENSI